MKSAKRKLLESKGFKVDSVQEFPDLSPEESKIIELKTLDELPTIYLQTLIRLFKD